MGFLSTYVAKRAEKVSEKKAKFALWASISFVLIGLMMIVDAKSSTEMLVAVACAGFFAWNAFLSSQILALKKQLS